MERGRVRKEREKEGRREEWRDRRREGGRD